MASKTKSASFSGTKDQWARDDPAFLVLLSASLASKSQCRSQEGGVGGAGGGGAAVGAPPQTTGAASPQECCWGLQTSAAKFFWGADLGMGGGGGTFLRVLAKIDVGFRP